MNTMYLSVDKPSLMNCLIYIIVFACNSPQRLDTKSLSMVLIDFPFPPNVSFAAEEQSVYHRYRPSCTPEEI